MAELKVNINRGAVNDLARSADMNRYMKNIAEEGAKEVERRAPRIVKQSGSRIFGTTNTTVSGVEGRVVVKSPFWHFPEFGHSRYAPRPYLRPGVQALLSRIGGRWKTN